MQDGDSVRLALELMEGNAVSRDMARGVSLVIRAHERGDVEGTFHLAKLYARGVSVLPRNEEMAQRLYEMAACRGHVLARAACYLFGWCGCEKDVEKALQLAETVLESDSGKLFAAYCLVGDDRESRDVCRAIGYYTELSERGVPAAMYNLALLYQRGKLVPRNLEKAVYLLKQVVEMEHPDAALCLGLMYEAGEGVGVDYRKAAAMYERAIALNERTALYYLGCMLCDGRGMTFAPDIRRGAALCREAAIRDVTPAQFRYAMMLTQGRGVKSNVVEANMWLRRAMVRGHSNARAKLGQVRNWRLASVLTCIGAESGTRIRSEEEL